MVRDEHKCNIVFMVCVCRIFYSHVISVGNNQRIGFRRNGGRTSTVVTQIVQGRLAVATTAHVSVHDRRPGEWVVHLDLINIRTTSLRLQEQMNKHSLGYGELSSIAIRQRTVSG